MVNSSRLFWKIFKKGRRRSYIPLLLLICLIIQLNLIQFNPNRYYNIMMNPKSSLLYDGTTTKTRGLKKTLKNTTTTTTTTTTTEGSSSSPLLSSSSFFIINNTNDNKNTTTTIVSTKNDEREDDDDVDVDDSSSDDDDVDAPMILNISTYDDLLEVLDFDRPHYCGYYKCYYSTTTTTKTNSNNNIGLIISQEDWITPEKLNSNQSYYDILYRSYIFSLQVTKEFPGIRNLLAGPPIQLLDITTDNVDNNNVNNNKPMLITVDQLYKLNHFNETTKTNVQRGGYNKRRIYKNNTILTYQEIYELQQIEIIQIKLHGRRTFSEFLNKHIIPNLMLNHPLDEISFMIQRFITTFSVDIKEIQLMLYEYPMMGVDFQLLIHMTGEVYQTDWDRIYFSYKWHKASYDPITKTNNHTITIGYVIPYLDDLIDICNQVLIEYNNKTITEQTEMLHIARKKAKY